MYYWYCIIKEKSLTDATNCDWINGDMKDTFCVLDNTFVRQFIKSTMTTNDKSAHKTRVLQIPRSTFFSFVRKKT